MDWQIRLAMAICCVVSSAASHVPPLATFVRNQVGEDGAEAHIEDLNRFIQGQYPPDFATTPLGEFDFLQTAKARETLIPHALDAAGLPGIPYTRYHEIAAVMEQNQIHPEVSEKLDGIQRAFNL